MTTSNNSLDKYDTKSPKISKDRIIDNPLLPHGGVPLKDDDFVDSTDRIIDSTNTNDLRQDKTTNSWIVDPSQFYGNGGKDGLAGIDVTPNSKKQFDLGKFNIVFDRNKEIAKENQRISDLNKLNALAQDKPKISLYNLSLYELIVNTKDAWFGLLDDLLDQRLELITFTKDNRLFYIGLTILIFSVILYLFMIIMHDDNNELTSDNNDKSNTKSNTKTIYHIHEYKYPQTPQNPQTLPFTNK